MIKSENFPSKINLVSYGEAFQNVFLVKETEKALQYHAQYFGRSREYNFTFWIPKSYFLKKISTDGIWLILKNDHFIKFHVVKSYDPVDKLVD